MDKKLVLMTADGQEMNIDEIALPSIHILMAHETFEEMQEHWMLLRTADLSEVTIMDTENGEAVALFHKLVLDSVQTVMNMDEENTMSVHYYFHESKR